MKENLSREELAAYTAGIIDGEGSIQIGKKKDQYGTYYHLHIEVTSTDHSLISWLYDRYKGYVGEHTVKHAHREAWRWSLQKTVDVESFVMEIFPYLITKRKQAINALDYLARKDDEGGDEFYTKMKEINKKGGKSRA